jgi:exodeoxyribonuclease VII large subunit
MILDGEGELQRKFLELKARLEEEGFFSPERKRPLPFLPKAVGIVTSKTGAVIHDMMVKLRERFPSMPTYLVDTRVQGEGAAQEIANAIRYLDRTKLVDVIIVARGGGSLEDLWSFNEEVVVKAVFASSVPVVSGVGHEVDVTLCDLAADVRAPTPTAAAEMVVPRVGDLLKAVTELERRLSEFERWFLPKVQRVDELSLRLQTVAGSLIKESTLRVRGAEARLQTIRPDRVVALLRSKIDLLHRRLIGTGQVVLQREARSVAVFADRLAAAKSRGIAAASLSVDHLAQRLEGISPRRVLERGFAVVKRGSVYLNSIQGVVAQDPLTVTLHDGDIVGVVERVNPKVS